MPRINFTEASAKDFKKAYLKAVKDEAESFVWDGKTFVVGYAKYLLEHLETNVFKKKL